ncbi:MAG: ATP-dependent sacrificial sulfur transferase LarE [Lachnospiraceae bacterium]
MLHFEEEQKIRRKMEDLKQLLANLGSIAIAFSGGVDSTFLLKVSYEVLGEKAIAITAQSSSFPRRELEEAKTFCQKEGVSQVIFPFHELEIEGFEKNPPDRCYLCKKTFLKKVQQIAAEKEIAYVAEGSNIDDEEDYRPGMRAVEELGIISPLRKVGLSKREIRFLSKELELDTWEKPSFACLSSRFPYGESITKEKLARVEQAEQLLLDLGFSQFRVRIHGDMARIEILPKEFPRLLQEENRQQVIEQLKSYGFAYIAMDLAGYRMGSMNEVL